MASQMKDEKEKKAAAPPAPKGTKKAAAADPAKPKAPAKKAEGEKPAPKKSTPKAPAKKAAPKEAAAHTEPKPKKAPSAKAHAEKAAETKPATPVIRVVTRPAPKPKEVVRGERPSLLSRPIGRPEPAKPEPPPEPVSESAGPVVQEVTKVDGHAIFRAVRPLSRIPHAAAPKPPAPPAPPKPAPVPVTEPEVEVEEEAPVHAVRPEAPAEKHPAPVAVAPEPEPEPEPAPAEEESSPVVEAEPVSPETEPEPEPEPELQAPDQPEVAPVAPSRPAVVAPVAPRPAEPQGPRGPRLHFGPGVKLPAPGVTHLPTAPVRLERRPPRVYDRTPSPAAMAAAARDAANRDTQRATSPLPPASAQRPGGARPSYNDGTSDSRRKTKRERRMEKLQARQDRKERIDQELADARETAATGEAVFIREGITVKELADKLNQKVRDVIAKLMMQKILVTINQPLDSEVAIQVANLFGYSAEIISFEDEISLTTEQVPEGDRVTRAPVVTVMGHVDHGKSSLLEAIHNINITSKEFGGITQHIGAYKVLHKDKIYVFLDTPGHEAFTLMRARGAKVTDVVILVVAADDGVMPQTIEAINHCKAANVPMIVAINKMDKPGADPDRVKRELSQQGVLTEDWGGDVVWCPVSAKKRQGIEELLEMVTIVSDMLNLKATPTAPCAGTVLESRLDRTRGPVATVLVQDGSLKVGDYFLCGATYGRVRGLFDDRGEKLETAGPSTPIEILGFSEVPAVGATFQGMEDEAKARQVASYRKEQEKQRNLRQGRVSLDSVFGQIQQGEIQELALILKADVQGSLEAVAKQINDLATSEVKVRIVHSAVGAVSESDVLLAAASKAVIVGFNVRPDRKASELAKSEAVDISLHTVIYDLVEQLRQALTGMLKPIERETILGHAEIREIFKVTGVGTIAGSLVVDGRVTRAAQVRLLRDNVIVHTGKLGSLKRFKDDASEVKEGTECGIGIENYNDLKPGDVIEAYETFQEARTL